MSKTKIVHLIKDDKFFDLDYEFWNTIPDVENIYILYLFHRKGQQPTYIKHVENVHICYSSAEVKKFFTSDVDMVYMESLCEPWIINSIPSHIKIVWWSWGCDIYYRSPSLLDTPLFKPTTLNWLNTRKKSITVSKILRALYLRIYARMEQKSISRIDAIQTVLPIEHDLLQAKGIHLLPFNKKFYSDEVIGRATQPAPQFTGSILLGNSATETNNHLDVLNAIENIYDDRNIVMPMNYGNMEYKDYVINHPEYQKFHITRLDTMLDFDTYTKLMNQCTTACFGHIRQQAIGNVCIAIAKGIKLFFFEDSVAYQQLKRDGYYVFSLDHINKTEFDTPLTPAQHLHNVELLRAGFKSMDDVALYVKSEINKLLKYK